MMANKTNNSYFGNPKAASFTAVGKKQIIDEVENKAKKSTTGNGGANSATHERTNNVPDFKRDFVTRKNAGSGFTRVTGAPDSVSVTSIDLNKQVKSPKLVIQTTDREYIPRKTSAQAPASEYVYISPKAMFDEKQRNYQNKKSEYDKNFIESAKYHPENDFSYLNYDDEESAARAKAANTKRHLELKQQSVVLGEEFKAAETDFTNYVNSIAKPDYFETFAAQDPNFSFYADAAKDGLEGRVHDPETVSLWGDMARFVDENEKVNHVETVMRQMNRVSGNKDLEDVPDVAGRVLMMTEEQKAVYNYYFGRGDYYAATQYLHTLKPSLDEAWGNYKAERYMNDPSKSDFQKSVHTVTENFSSATWNAVTDLKQAVDTYVFLNRYVNKRDAATHEAAALHGLSGPKTQLVAELASGIGYMTPSILAGPFGEIVLSLTSAGGNYRNAREEGYTHNKAFAYGLASGASTYVANKLLGGVISIGGGALSKATSKNGGKYLDDALGRFVKSPFVKDAIKTARQWIGLSASEFIEEDAEAVADAFLRNWIFNENNSLNPFEPEYLRQGLLGAVTAATLNLPHVRNMYMNNKYSRETTEKMDCIHALEYIVSTNKTEFDDLSPEAQKIVTQNFADRPQELQDFIRQKSPTGSMSKEAQKMVEDASDATIGKKNAAYELGTKENFERFSREVDNVFRGERPYATNIILGETTALLKQFGAVSDNITISPSAIYKIAYPSKYLEFLKRGTLTGKEKSQGHNLGVPAIKHLLGQIADPVALLKSNTQEKSLIILTEWEDKNGAPVIIPLHLNKQGAVEIENRVASAYGKGEIEALLGDNDSNVLWTKKNKDIHQLLSIRLQLPEAKAEDVFGNSLTYNVRVVNNESSSKSDTFDTDIPMRHADGSVRTYNEYKSEQETTKSKKIEALGVGTDAEIEQRLNVLLTPGNAAACAELLFDNKSNRVEGGFLDAHVMQFDKTLLAQYRGHIQKLLDAVQTEVKAENDELKKVFQGFVKRYMRGGCKASPELRMSFFNDVADILQKLDADSFVEEDYEYYEQIFHEGLPKLLGAVDAYIQTVAAAQMVDMGLLYPKTRSDQSIYFVIPERKRNAPAPTQTHIEAATDVHFPKDAATQGQGSQIKHNYTKAIDDILTVDDATAKKEADNRTVVEIRSNTPRVILDNVDGAADLPIIMNYSKLYLALRHDGIFKGHYHNLGRETASLLPEILENPDAIVQLSNGRLNILSEIKTDRGNNGIISVELNSVKDIDKKNDKYNVVVTMFSSDDAYVKNLLSSEGVSVKYKREDLSQVNPQLYKWLATINDKSSQEESIPQPKQEVNVEVVNKLDISDAVKQSIESPRIKADTSASFAAKAQMLDVREKGKLAQLSGKLLTKFFKTKYVEEPLGMLTRDIRKRCEIAACGDPDLEAFLNENFLKYVDGGQKLATEREMRDAIAIYKFMNEIGIRAGSKESAAAQMLGEGYWQDKYGERHDYTLQDVKNAFPDTWEKIVQVKDFVRSFYDRVGEEANKELTIIHPDAISYYEAEMEKKRTRIEELRDKPVYIQTRIRAIEAQIVKVQTTIEKLRARKDTKADVRRTLDEIATKKEAAEQAFEARKRKDTKAAAEDEARAARYEDKSQRIQRENEAYIENQMAMLVRKKMRLEGDLRKLQQRISDAALADDAREISKLELEMRDIENGLDTGELIRDKLILHKDNYFHHFKADKKSAAAKLVALLEKKTAIAPELVGTSRETKPKRRFEGFMQHQGLDEYTPDALGGLLRYIPQVHRKVASDYVLVHGREFVKSIALATKDTKNANGLLEAATEYLNTMAGKTNFFDRPAQMIRGRKFLQFIDIVSGARKAALFPFSFTIAMKQFSNIANLPYHVKNAKAVAKGLWDMKGLFNKDSEQSKIIAQSAFLNERYIDKFYRKLEGKIAPKRISSFMLEAGDQLATNLIWFSAYEDAVRNKDALMKKGENPGKYGDPIRYADNIARQCVGGRGQGELPPILESKTVRKMFPFAVESLNSQHNFTDAMRKGDIVGVVFSQLITAGINAGLATLGLGAVGFDFVDAIIDIFDIFFGADDEDDEEETIADKTKQSAQRLAAELLETRWYASLYSVFMGADGWESLLGDSYDENVLSNELLAFSPVADAIRKNDVREILYGYIPGGAQIKRTKNFLQDVGYLPEIKTEFGKWPEYVPRQNIPASYTDDGKLRFPIDPSLSNYVLGTLFGEYATKEGKSYIDESRTPMSEEKTAEFNAIVNAGTDPVIAYDTVNTVSELGNEASRQKAYALMKTGISAEKTVEYMQDISKIKSDRDNTGNTVSGSQKKKQVRYIFNLNISAGQKGALYRNCIIGADDKKMILAQVYGVDDATLAKAYPYLAVTEGTIGANGKTISGSKNKNIDAVLNEIPDLTEIQKHAFRVMFMTGKEQESYETALVQALLQSDRLTEKKKASFYAWYYNNDKRVDEDALIKALLRK